MQYDVHIYAIVRVKVCGVEADTQEVAIQRAEEATDLNAAFSGVRVPSTYTTETEYADDVDGFLVDEANDPEHHKSKFYNKEGRPA